MGVGRHRLRGWRCDELVEAVVRRPSPLDKLDVVSAGGTSLTILGLPRSRLGMTAPGRVDHRGGVANISLRRRPAGATIPSSGRGIRVSPRRTGFSTHALLAGLVPRGDLDLSFPSDPSAGGAAAYWQGRWPRSLRRHQQRLLPPTPASSPAPTRAASASSAGSASRSMRRSRRTGGTFTDITDRQQVDSTSSLGGHRLLAWASMAACAVGGLGQYRVDPTLALGLAGAGGPVGGGREHGAGLGGRGRDDRRGRLRQRHLGHVRRQAPGVILVQSATTITVIPPNAAFAQCGRHGGQLAGPLGSVRRRPLVFGGTLETVRSGDAAPSPPTVGSSPTATAGFDGSAEHHRTSNVPWLGMATTPA